MIINKWMVFYSQLMVINPLYIKVMIVYNSVIISEIDGF